MPQKLCLIVVDSLRTDMLERAAADGDAPNFAALLERGVLIPDCVSAFPSVTPVCCSEIVTGELPGPSGPEPVGGHRIVGMNWFDRLGHRYVEYGNSFEATRAFGLFRTLYDIVYNMNMSHLSPEAETVFERLGDAGIRTACTPFLIYRGRTRHELSLEGLMRQLAVAAKFRHAVWGPEELFWGELYASRKVDCKPTLARPGTRDEYSACVGRELVREDLYDFLLFSLPDNDYFAHKNGPEQMPESIAHADRCFGELVEEAGGIDAFLDTHAVILMADHAQSEVEHEVDLQEELGREWRVLQPNDQTPDVAELAVCATARAAGVYVLAGGPLGQRAHADVRARLGALEAVDLMAWIENADGEPLIRRGPEPVAGDTAWAVVERAGGGLRFRPGTEVGDRRGARWDLDGDLAVLAGEVRDGRFDSERYPDALERLWSALASPNAAEIMVSLEVGWEAVDWGGMSHLGGGSHGSLEASDSLVPLVMVGFEPGTEATREQWKIADVAGLVLSHFGIGDGPRVRATADRIGAPAE